MTEQQFAIFDTPIGRCGIVWGERGIVSVQLPMGDENKTRTRLQQRHGDLDEAPPPANVQAAIAGIVELLAGKPNDLADVVLDLDARTALGIRRIVLLGCGTAYYAGLAGAQLIEDIARIPAAAEPAAEFGYRNPVIDREALYVAISQSGETADTLMAIRHAREQRSKVLAICNTNGSTIPRESDAVIYTHAGPEIGVASTKGFMTQLVACYLLALYLAQVRGTKFGDEIAVIVDELDKMPDHVQRMLDEAGPVHALAEELSSAR